VNFETAVLQGYAEDGGLYVPERIPEFDWNELRKVKDDYEILAFKVLRPFIGTEELSDVDLRTILNACYASFPSNDKVKLRKIKEGLFILELFHGPTLCFKDLGLPFLVQLVAHFAAKRDESRTLLVATSGDTGPACVAATETVNSNHVRVFCCYPKGMVSNFQRAQMRRSKRALIASFEGGGDDMDAVLKKIGSDSTLKASGVNSYNIARPLAQCVHFIWLSLQFFNNTEPNNIKIVIPTGAMGNLVAAILAKKIGAPFSKILCACNSNDFTFRAITLCDATKSSHMLKTVSDAINIQVPYNFERLLYFAGGVEYSLLMSQIYSGQHVALNNLNLAQTLALEAVRVDDQRTLEAISFFSHDNFIPDPHTAVALAATQDQGWCNTDLRDSISTVVVLATAHARKFKDVVLPVVGEERWRTYIGNSSDPLLPSNHLSFNRISPDEDLTLAQQRWEQQLRNLLEDASLWDV